MNFILAIAFWMPVLFHKVLSTHADTTIGFTCDIKPNLNEFNVSPLKIANIQESNLYQDPIWLEMNDISMFNVIEALEIQINNCKHEIQTSTILKTVGTHVQQQQHGNCPYNWKRKLFDWITHGSYQNNCIANKQFELTFKYAFETCMNKMQITTDVELSEFEKQMRSEITNEYFTDVNRLLDNLWILTTVQQQQQQQQLQFTDQSMDQSINNQINDLLNAIITDTATLKLKYQSSLQTCYSNRAIFPHYLSHGGFATVYEAGSQPNKITVFKKLTIDRTRKEVVELSMETLKYTSYISKGLGQCANQKVNQIDSELWSQIYAKSDNAQRSFGYFVREFIDAGVGTPYAILPLTTIPAGYSAYKSATEIANTLTISEKVEVIIKFLEALKCMHDEHIIHRDIKPANVIVSRRVMNVPVLLQNWKDDIGPNVNVHNKLFNVFIVDIDAALHLKNNDDDGFADPQSPRKSKKGRGEMTGTPIFIPPEIIHAPSDTGSFSSELSASIMSRDISPNSNSDVNSPGLSGSDRDRESPVIAVTPLSDAHDETQVYTPLQVDNDRNEMPKQETKQHLLKPINDNAGNNAPVFTKLLSPKTPIANIRKQVDKGSDIWSAGIMFFTWIAGDFDKQTLPSSFDWLSKVGSVLEADSEYYEKSGIDILLYMTNVQTEIPTWKQDMENQNHQWIETALQIIRKMTAAQASERPNISELITMWSDSLQLLNVNDNIVQYNN